MSPITPGFYYYGCWSTTGHYLFQPGGRRIDYLSTPFGYDLDGRVQPVETHDAYCRGNGIPALRLVHRDGWTAVGFWDNTVDSRPKSCGAFVCIGSKNLEQVLAEAKVQFPEIWLRLHGGTKAGTQ